MYRLEKTLMREERYRHDRDNPSFSSTLLDKIYRSINDDDGYSKHEDLKFYRETMQKKQGKGNRRRVEEEEEEELSSFQRACLIEKWMDKKFSEKANAEKKQIFSEFERKLHHENDHDVLFFSSSSSSSDSSSGGFSSSDTESIHGRRAKSSGFVPKTRPKPVRTSVLARPEKPRKTETTGKTARTLFYEQRELHMFDDYHYHSASDYTPKLDETLFKSKSRAMKIYGDLKKVKQPVSPGGRLASFISSLFTTGHTKKTKSSSSMVSCDDERKFKSGAGQVSTCSSASSFSRSCLSKNSPSTRERLRNGVKRTVRFCPVSVIVDEDSRPCGQKCLYQEEEEEEDSSLLSVSVPTAWKIGKSPSRKCEEELKYKIMEKTRRVEEMAREFLKEYHLNRKKNDFISRETRNNYVVDEMNEDDDDAASYSSSDLFELDHLVLIGNDRYREDLPVYETTSVETNRAIANGLIV